MTRRIPWSKADYEALDATIVAEAQRPAKTAGLIVGMGRNAHQAKHGFIVTGALRVNCLRTSARSCTRPSTGDTKKCFNRGPFRNRIERPGDGSERNSDQDLISAGPARATPAPTLAGDACARSCDHRYVERAVDLHPRTGHRPGESRRASHAGQPGRHSTAAANSMDGRFAGSGVSADRVSPGLDAGSRTGSERLVRVSHCAGQGTQARSAAPESIVLWKPSGRDSTGSRGSWRFDQLVEGGAWPRTQRVPLDALVSGGSDTRFMARRRGGRAFGMDAGRNSHLLHPSAAGCGDPQRPQSAFV